MFETPYYHGIIRKCVIGFGALFSKIKVPRQDNNGVIQQTIAVPLTYGPKEKIFVKLRQDKDFQQQLYTTLPRMTFEIVALSPDTDRKLNKQNQIRCWSVDGLQTTFAPVPYLLNIDLHILSKGTEDALCILEQILPTFNPQYTLTIKAVEPFNIAQDVPVNLDGVSIMDDYEGDFSVRRFVTHTLSFTLPINLYGPVLERNQILETNTNIDQFAQHTSTGDPLTGEITSDFWTEPQ